MKLNRFDGHAWPFLGDMNLLEVKTSDWTLCTKKSEFLRKIYMDFFLQLNYSLWSKLSYLNSKVRIYGKYWLPMTICWTWLDLENYNFIGIIVWWMILISLNNFYSIKNLCDICRVLKLYMHIPLVNKCKIDQI